MNARGMVRVMALLVLSSCQDHPEERGLTDLQLKVRSFCDRLVYELDGSTRTYREFVAAGADERVMSTSLWSIGLSREARHFKVYDFERRLQFCAYVRKTANAAETDALSVPAFEAAESLVRGQDPRSSLPSHEETLRGLEELTERARKIVAVPLIE